MTDLFNDNIKIGETCFCTYSRPRYQVSVYRAMGILVFPCYTLKFNLIIVVINWQSIFIRVSIELDVINIYSTDFVHLPVVRKIRAPSPLQCCDLNIW